MRSLQGISPYWTSARVSPGCILRPESVSSLYTFLWSLIISLNLGWECQIVEQTGGLLRHGVIPTCLRQLPALAAQSGQHPFQFGWAFVFRTTLLR